MLDLAGIGIGPFNLSVAALLDNSGISHRFFDAKPTFAWHPGLLLPEAHMQTCYLKDLVTAVNPASEHSFLAYLVAKKRFYRFLSAELSTISRAEFSDYMAWVAAKLPSLSFNSPVQRISFERDHFVIDTAQQQFRAKHLCLGTGKKPFIPVGFRQALNTDVFHASEMMQRKPDFSNKRVLIIGGGQTGADIVLNALANIWGKPQSLHWISRRANYQPLDEACFTNEYFTPGYTERFYTLPQLTKEREIKAQKLTSDGITTACLKAIYQQMYQRFDVNAERRWLHLLPNRSATNIAAQAGGYTASCINSLNQQHEHYPADIVILATGFTPALPELLAPLSPMLALTANGELQLGPDFDVQWRHQRTNRIYAVNAGLHSHGIAEPQLSLMAWRSATIINHLAQRQLYDLADEGGFIDWLAPNEAAGNNVGLTQAG